MYLDHTILAVIPARAGSKRLRGKNIKPFCGKPLIEWTVFEAQKSKYLDNIAVSSDDKSIFDLLLKKGYSIIWHQRPARLATDQSSSEDVVREFIEQSLMGPWDLTMLLQPTSPLRISADIDEAIELFFKPVDRIISFGYNVDPTVLQPSGATYLLRTQSLLRGASFYSPDGARIQLTPPERFADIDDQSQFDEAETKNARHGCEPSS